MSKTSLLVSTAIALTMTVSGSAVFAAGHHNAPIKGVPVGSKVGKVPSKGQAPKVSITPQGAKVMKINRKTPHLASGIRPVFTVETYYNPYYVTGFYGYVPLDTPQQIKCNQAMGCTLVQHSLAETYIGINGYYIGYDANGFCPVIDGYFTPCFYTDYGGTGWGWRNQIQQESFPLAEGKHTVQTYLFGTYYDYLGRWQNDYNVYKNTP